MQPKGAYFISRKEHVGRTAVAGQHVGGNSACLVGAAPCRTCRMTALYDKEFVSE